MASTSRHKGSPTMLACLREGPRPERRSSSSASMPPPPYSSQASHSPPEPAHHRWSQPLVACRTRQDRYTVEKRLHSTTLGAAHLPSLDFTVVSATSMHDMTRLMHYSAVAQLDSCLRVPLPSPTAGLTGRAERDLTLPVLGAAMPWADREASTHLSSPAAGPTGRAGTEQPCARAHEGPWG